MPDVTRVILRMSPFAGYERGVLSGIARYARLQGRWVLSLSGVQSELPLPTFEGVSGGKVLRSRYCDSAGRDRRLPNLRRLHAAGFIGRIQTPVDAEAVLDAGVPVVAMGLSTAPLSAGHLLTGLSEIRTDSYAAGQMAAAHLLERGFRHFGFCGYSECSWSKQREAGFTDELEKTGIKCAVYEPSGKSFIRSWTTERARMTAWLSSLPKPVGVMACNDLCGLRVIEACAVGDMTVPDNVAVMGVDDDLILCALSNPPLSSVLLNGELAGYQAAELLDRMMSGQATERQTILAKPLWVVPRRSTDVLAVEDHDVARAMQFIRDNVHRSVNVADVVREMAMSRRILEIRFQRVLGRSIHEEIRRERLNKTRQLLVETDMPIGRIAEMVGFSSISYASKVFQRECGATLGNYRRDNRIP